MIYVPKSWPFSRMPTVISTRARLTSTLETHHGADWRGHQRSDPSAWKRTPSVENSTGRTMLYRGSALSPASSTERSDWRIQASTRITPLAPLPFHPRGGPRPNGKKRYKPRQETVQAGCEPGEGEKTRGVKINERNNPANPNRPRRNLGGASQENHPSHRGPLPD